MSAPLLPGAAIGIIGGGQLGRMSAMAAARLGYRCHIYAPDADGPASQVSALTQCGAYDDLDALRAFGRGVEVVTFEFENVSAAGLDALAAVTPVYPSPDILRTSQDRLAEKNLFRERRRARWPLAGSHRSPPVSTPQWQNSACQACSKPPASAMTAAARPCCAAPPTSTPPGTRLAPKPLILEKFVDFACELSVIVARTATGQIAAFDTVENRHRHHILDLTLAPAQVTPDIADTARALAIAIAEKLDLVGLLAIEMFVDRNGHLLVNEMAPRPAQLRPLDHRRLPRQPVRDAYPRRRRPPPPPSEPPRRRRDEKPRRPRRLGPLANHPRHPRPDPPPLRQGRSKGQAAKWAT